MAAAVPDVVYLLKYIIQPQVLGAHLRLSGCVLFYPNQKKGSETVGIPMKQIKVHIWGVAQGYVHIPILN